VGITFKARGSSVERNQVKRQVREYFRTHRDALGSYDYNVVIPGTKKISYPYAKKLGQSLREQFIHAIARS
jgi:ribonuclease P protein component